MMKIAEVLNKSRTIIYKAGIRGWIKAFKDERYLKLMYWANTGKKLNIENPVTYNEKLQWLKIHDRNPDYSKLVDKYEAKNWISEKIGEEYVIPTLGVWNSYEDIPFDELPDRFVLKCTHDSGGVFIYRGREAFNRKTIKKKITSSLKKNYYTAGREYPYKNIKPRISAEPYMQEGSGFDYLTDYKFFCFNGEPKVCYVGHDKSDKPTTDFFDMDFNHLPIRMRDRNADETPCKPETFDEMKRIAALLSREYPHLRVDFYYIDGRVYVGELTLYHCSGFVEVYPEEWNRKLGDWIDIDSIIIQ